MYLTTEDIDAYYEIDAAVMYLTLSRNHSFLA